MGQHAARVGDAHICPMTDAKPHVGGPVLPSGCPTVLIGGQPAARLGDMAQCVGPTDLIVQGEVTVLIGGQPAARLGDVTAHGGRISVGFATVQIGFAPGAGSLTAPESCFLCRQRLAKAAQQSNDPNVQQAGKDLERLNHDLEHAKLADHVYEPREDGKEVPPPEGWREVTDPAELAELGLEPSDLTQEGSDFRAKVYAPDPEVFGDSMKPTVVFKGSSTTEDWINNAQQGLGLHSDYYENAVGIGKAVDASGADVEFAGHSLGGGLASAASSASGIPATTFNAAGLHSDTVTKYGGTPQTSQINAYQVEGEILTGLQENSWKGVGKAALVGGLLGGLKGAVVGGLLKTGLAALLPDALGDAFKLPGTGNPISRHLMDHVLPPLEEQIAALEKMLEDATGIHCDC